MGEDVGVAVVDSGIANAKDLLAADRLLSVNFNPNFQDSTDRYGHGTFVAGMISGNGEKYSGRYLGIAPKAELLNVRVSDNKGMATESDVVTGLQWVWENKDAFNIRVVNLSLNSSVAQSYHTSPMNAAVEMLWFRGVVVVVSAGTMARRNSSRPPTIPL